MPATVTHPGPAVPDATHEEALRYFSWLLSGVPAPHLKAAAPVHPVFAAVHAWRERHPCPA
jgi:hypothetical protein